MAVSHGDVCHCIVVNDAVVAITEVPDLLMLESEAFCSAFIALRCGWEVPDDILPDVEKFVCTLYGKKDSASVNAARYNLFRLICQSEALPPYQDCLKHQIAGQITRLQFIVAPSNGSLTRLLQ